MMSAQRVGSDLGTVNAVVGHITLSQHCETCHGTGAGGDRSEQTRLVKECRSLLSDMKTNEKTAEGKKLLDDLETAGTGWLDVNVRVLELGLAGKSAEALALYRDESIPSVGPVQHALAGYVSWQQQRLSQKRESADKIMRQLPIPIAVLSLIALAISTLLGVVVTRSIAGRSTTAVTLLENVANGDVTQEVTTEYLARKRRNRPARQGRADYVRTACAM